MATYSQLPGELNLDILRGDELSISIDFSVDVTGYTVSSNIVSLVDSASIVSPAVTITDAGNGVVSLALTETQTAALPSGSRRLFVSWVAPGDVPRRVLAGIVEVKP